MADEDERACLERIVAIACDQGGFTLKESLKVALPDVKWLDLGTNSADSVDYPDSPASWPMPSRPARPNAAF